MLLVVRQAFTVRWLYQAIKRIPMRRNVSTYQNLVTLLCHLGDNGGRGN